MERGKFDRGFRIRISDLGPERTLNAIQMLVSETWGFSRFIREPSLPGEVRSAISKGPPEFFAEGKVHEGLEKSVRAPDQMLNPNS